MSTYISPDSGHLVVKSVNDLDLNNISSDDAALFVQGGQYLEGNLYVGGTLVVNGDVITLGNAGGSLTFNANVSSDILPSTTETYNIGSDLEKWNSVFAKTLQTEKLQITTSSAVVAATVDVSTSVNHIDATTPVSASLANGDEGQVLSIIVVKTPAAAVAVTPASPLGFSSIILTNSGDSVTMIFTGGSWAIVSLFRASVI
jgi:hypothetical protein